MKLVTVQMTHLTKEDGQVMGKSSITGSSMVYMLPTTQVIKLTWHWEIYKLWIKFSCRSCIEKHLKKNCIWKIILKWNNSYVIGNQTRDLLPCSIMPEPAMLKCSSCGQYSRVMTEHFTTFYWESWGEISPCSHMRE